MAETFASDLEITSIYNSLVESAGIVIDTEVKDDLIKSLMKLFL